MQLYAKEALSAGSTVATTIKTNALLQEGDEGCSYSGSCQRNIHSLLVTSLYRNLVFGVYKWLVPILRHFLCCDHNIGHVEQRLQPIYLHSDLSEIQESVSKGFVMVSVKQDQECLKYRLNQYKTPFCRSLAPRNEVKDDDSNDRFSQQLKLKKHSFCLRVF